MDHNDRIAIEGLFDKVAQTAQTQSARDPEAEALIADRIAATPGAAYVLAQTVIMQEQALNAAQDRLQRTPQTQPQSSGLFGGLFGGGQQAAPRPAAPQPQQTAPRPGPWGGARAGGGGGFLAGAAQTAMGVAGGVLLGQAIGGMFAGSAEAAGMDEGSGEEPGFDEGGFDDGGFDGGFE
ncbi:hypothetical protein SAMN04488003_11750 [Loktanella fryxellensis]|uniref:DUF2076 domain-containing protein n=1 Tax=Loktanella fryxellensis TaxID=245187 RepID=A0A1H8GR70_9RHOB|nr:DUF2076 family protein [Loktanella fryxellensis]SEN46320.1 hypothetical protein SAMN04488003_11750 [Loktanella fryxellensis]